jgi:hypothetical protein
MIYRVIVLSLLTAFAVVSMGYAGNCYGYNYGYTYQQPYYNYNQYYYEKKEVNPVLVIGVPVTNLGLPYYYSVGADLREEALIEKITKTMKQQNLIPQQQQATPAYNQVQQAAYEAQPQQAELVFNIIGGNAVVAQSDDLDKRVYAILDSNRCATCHKAGQSKPGGVQLFNSDGTLFKAQNPAIEKNRRKAVYDQIAEGLMPKNGKVIKGTDTEVLRKWKEAL